MLSKSLILEKNEKIFIVVVFQSYLPHEFSFLYFRILNIFKYI